jgi:alpha-beta hydrolase superfamily lysophospholipase
MAVLALGIYLPYGRAYGLVHPARAPIERTPANVGISSYQDVQFVTADGLTLYGWYVPPRNGAVVVFVHGLGGNRTELLDEAGFITAKGYGALLFDLRNHGKSEGNVSTLGLYEVRDIEAAVAFVRQTAEPDAPVAAFGHSMGAATVLLATAAISEIDAVIAESAFTSVEDNISDSVQVLTGLPAFPFAPLVVFFGQREAGVDISAVRPVDIIASISPRAVLLIHGDLDATIPVRNAYALYEAAAEPKELYVLPGVGHGGFLWAQPEEYPKRILAFLEKYLLR